VGKTFVNKLRDLGKYLYRAKCVLGKAISNHGNRMEDDGRRAIVITVEAVRICMIIARF
jgi:hypothetical protein